MSEIVVSQQFNIADGNQSGIPLTPNATINADPVGTTRLVGCIVLRFGTAPCTLLPTITVAGIKLGLRAMGSNPALGTYDTLSFAIELPAPSVTVNGGPTLDAIVTGTDGSYTVSWQLA